jgi:periplasmic protein CpxP/Spy
MPQPIASAARSLAVAALLGTVALACPLPAAADQPVAPAQLAQATPPAPPPAATPKKPRRSRADRVEQRIASLHQALQITPDQETQWNAVAQAMRDHAGLMQQAIEHREQNPAMTAVDDLKAYQGIAEANAQGMQKLVPAFETLYASLSDDQKKEADVLFAHSRHHRKSSKTPQ